MARGRRNESRLVDTFWSDLNSLRGSAAQDRIGGVCQDHPNFGGFKAFGEKSLFLFRSSLLLLFNGFLFFGIDRIDGLDDWFLVGMSATFTHDLTSHFS